MASLLERKEPKYGTLRAIVDLNNNHFLESVEWQKVEPRTGYRDERLYRLRIKMDAATLIDTGLVVPTAGWPQYNNLQLHETLVAYSLNNAPTTDKYSSKFRDNFLMANRKAVLDGKNFFEWKPNLSEIIEPCHNNNNNCNCHNNNDDKRYIIFYFTAIVNVD